MKEFGAGIAIIIWLTTGIVSLLWSMSVIVENIGILGGFIAFFFFPITIVFTPFYVGFSTGNWTLLIITYGGGILATIIMSLSSGDSGNA